jgi:hypothetical protein
MSATQQTLAQMVRSKYPHAYDDLDDATLEKNVLAKHPEYSDLPKTSATPTKSYGEGTNVNNAAEGFAAKALSGAGLPTSLANIPDWFHHLIGTAKDSEPWWKPVREAIKNPTQENIVAAVPFIGPMSVSMAKDVREGNYSDAAGTMAGGIGAVLGAKQVSPGLKAGKTELAEATRTPANKLTPATRGLTRAGATVLGSATLGPGGGIAGALGGPAIADALLPERPPPTNFMGGAYSEFAGESGKAVPLSQSPNASRLLLAKMDFLQKQKAAAAAATQVIPEPRATLPTDKPGAMWSIGREKELPAAARRGAPGAGDVMQNLNQPIIYTPKEGAGYPGPRKLSDLSGEMQGGFAKTPPPAIAPVLKETGWEYGGKSSMGVNEFKQPGTNISISVLDKDMNAATIRAKIAAKLKEFNR